MFHESGSESTKTGVAPRYVTGWLEAQNVKDCTSTSSPGPTPHASRARWTAAVPALRHATALSSVAAPSSRRLTNAASSSSKAFTFGPIGTTQFESKASFMKSISRPLMWARQR